MDESTLEERPGDFPKVTQGKYLGTWEGLDTESNYVTPMFFLLQQSLELQGIGIREMLLLGL